MACAASGERAGVLLRLGFPLFLLEAALWSPRPLAVLCGLCSLWYVAWLLWPELRSAGLLMDLRRIVCERWMLGGTILLAAVLLTAAEGAGSLHRLWGLHRPWLAMAAYALWALVQEFLLQCFCLRMLRAVLSKAAALVATGAIFAMAHLPNPGLTLLTFFAGIAFSTIYLFRRKNLILVATIHAILGLTLAVSAPEDWMHGLRVGRNFLHPPTTVAALDEQEH